LQEAGASFDQIYEHNVANFGPELRPGIDGDLRLHILNASPGAICDSAARCGLLGYFSSSDALPRVVNEYSNERDMFVMNGERFGSVTYIHVLAHEFRHMIEDNYDRSDADWEVEGSAMLAEDLAGYSFSAVDRGNAFLANPDQQLNRWSDSNTYAYYGQGYVLNRYIYDRLGPALYRAFAMHPADGLQAVTAVAQENGLDLDGHSLWLDWLAALALHRHPQAPPIYRLGDGQLNTASMTTVSSPTAYDTTVYQYASDYYRLEGDTIQGFMFAGSRNAPLMGIAAASGGHFWYAHRVNYSHMQLQREFDLRAINEATLNYAVYYDIEQGYDFAYVSVSEDGGTTWQGLEAAGMQGLLPDDDPGDAALTERYYTGRANQWVQEQIDLTPYAGKVIQLRFSYVTDPILTFGGVALDNISIPDVGYYDDAERDDRGWQTHGFTRAPATMPQSWHLMLITFENDVPLVTALEVDETGALSHTLGLAPGEEAILIVAATSPMTLEPASYRLQFGN
jgi:immune inhibitor A